MNELQTRASEDHALIDWLRDRDVACPMCRYNIRGLTVPRCPECGHSLRLTVAIADVYSKAWISMTMVLSAGAGLGFFFFVLLLQRGWPGPSPGLDFLGAIIEIAAIPIAMVALLTRRAFQRAARRTQWVIASLAMALVVTGFLLFFCNW